MSEQPIKIYVISKGWRIGRVVAGVFYILAGVILFHSAYQGPTPISLSGLIVLCGMGMIFLALSLYLLLNTFKFRLEIWPNKIRQINFFGENEMQLEDIDGYRLSQKGSGGSVFFISEKMKKKLRVFLMLENQNEFKQWFETNFKDLGTIETEKELASALSDERLGVTEEQRSEVLKKTKKKVARFGLLLLPFTYWGYLHPHPYQLFVWISVLVPLVGIGLLISFPGIFRFSAVKSSVYVSIDSFLVLPIFVLAVRALLDWRILDWKPFWIPFAGIILVLFVLLFVFVKDFYRKMGTVFLWLFFCAIYSYAAIISLNGILDMNVPAKYSSKVIDKRMVQGRLPEYYMTLTPWGPVTEQKELQVYGNVYQQKAIGNPVTVALKNGAFKIPFYYVY